MNNLFFILLKEIQVLMLNIKNSIFVMKMYLQVKQWKLLYLSLNLLLI